MSAQWIQTQLFLFAFWKRQVSYFRFITDVVNLREELEAIVGADFFKCDFF